MADHKLPSRSNTGEIADFLAKVRAIPATTQVRRGRLVFAMDATASREATWASAQRIHAAMFDETAKLGGLDVQLVWYRGMAEFHAGPWTSQADALVGQLKHVDCLGGETQIAKVLRHVLAETRVTRVNACVFVGDCMEEDVDALCRQAGELGVLGVPLFLFHEGEDPVAANAFRQMAKLSGGASVRFDARSAASLRELLSAVAVFAAGGRQAMLDYGRAKGGAVLQITRQLEGR
ncbi:MAG: VWA domain-containing protein [Actinomycetota bacterium]